MADPVSWFVIERGWQVVGSDGSELGTIEETVGDSARDIFDGLTVGTGLLSKPCYVPAELVGEIVEGRVALTIGKDEFERLDEYREPPPTEQVGS
jgi:PRC-barrel domain protein